MNPEITWGTWSDGQPYFERDWGPRGIVQVTAIPAMAYWMVCTLLWLIEDGWTPPSS